MTTRYTPIPEPPVLANDEFVRRLQQRVETSDLIRRAVVHFNASHWDQALALFQQAQSRGITGTSLANHLADCYLAMRRPVAAAMALAKADPTSVVDRLRLVSCLWESGQRRLALTAIRTAVASDPECADYHYSLGTILAEQGDYDEAELRFAQVLSIDRDHVDAMVNLALCHGARGHVEDAFSWLQRAQAHRPGDGRIGVMVTQAAKTLARRGMSGHVRPTLRTCEETDDHREVDRLSRLIESDPDFVDALLMLSEADVDESLLAVLLATLQRVLERQPEQAELHHHVGRVLDRLGQPQAAIEANERAVAIDPAYIGALIELGHLYQQRDRSDMAATRWEQAIRAGADYADIHFLLGNLYRRLGRVEHAGRAYCRALQLNDHYTTAKEALDTLCV